MNSPNEVLYVIESRAAPHRKIWAYDPRPDGTLANRRLVVDVQGNLWCGWGSNGAAGADAEVLDGVRVFAPDGTPIGHIHLPERCANVCLAAATATACSWRRAIRCMRRT